MLSCPDQPALVSLPTSSRPDLAHFPPCDVIITDLAKKPRICNQSPAQCMCRVLQSCHSAVCRPSSTDSLGWGDYGVLRFFDSKCRSSNNVSPTSACLCLYSRASGSLWAETQPCRPSCDASPAPLPFCSSEGSVENHLEEGTLGLFLFCGTRRPPEVGHGFLKIRLLHSAVFLYRGQRTGWDCILSVWDSSRTYCLCL